MVNISVGWYVGFLVISSGVSYVIGYFCGRIDGKVR